MTQDIDKTSANLIKLFDKRTLIRNSINNVILFFHVAVKADENANLNICSIFVIDKDQPINITNISDDVVFVLNDKSYIKFLKEFSGKLHSVLIETNDKNFLSVITIDLSMKLYGIKYKLDFRQM